MAKPMTDKLKGRGKQAAGKAKETTSELIGDDRTAAEGRSEQTAGKAQETWGKGKEQLKKAVDKL
jgi:uncharacterized protein YjbJ (UPF0337 family)